mgnify:CR=1 FL=1
MKLTAEYFEKMSIKELNEFVNKWFDRGSEDSMWDKLSENYCEEKIKEFNNYATYYKNAKNGNDEDREEKMRGYYKAMGSVLSDVSENLEKYNEYSKLKDELYERKSKIEKEERYVKWEELRSDFFEKMENISEEDGISPDEIDEMINTVKYVKNHMNEELEQINEFDQMYNEVEQKIGNLEDNKSLTEKLRYYKEKSGNISSDFYSSVIKSKFQADRSIREMAKLKYSVDNIDNEFRSFKTLDKEKLEKNETKENKVKNYIKSKIGNARYFETKVVDYSGLYKGKNKFMPLEEMREIYGSKGALMMICRLEDGSLGKKKHFSTYRKFCKKILEGYRSLKVEAAITALESGKVNASDLGEDKAEKLNNLLYELNELRGWDTSKFKLADFKNKNFSFSKFFSSTKSQIAKLKNTKGAKNADRKKLIDDVVKEFRKVESELTGESNVEGTIENGRYVKKYNNFVEQSAKLAVTYLKSEGKKKIERVRKASSKNYKEKGKEYYAIDVCKVALMCLVAVCSKNEGYIAVGQSYFASVIQYLREIIG